MDIKVKIEFDVKTENVSNKEELTELVVAYIDEMFSQNETKDLVESKDIKLTITKGG